MAEQAKGAKSAKRPTKNRLGKGLGALLGEYLPEEAGPGDAGYRVVPVSSIVANPFQPRREFTAEQLSELEGSIRENGLLQPLVVRPAPAGAPEGAEWELVAGERRWRAIRRLGWTEVPVIVREMDDRTLLVLAIVENVQRADLSAVEEALGYQRLIEEFGYTQKEVAEQVGKERSTVANLLRLLHLPASVQRLVSEGSLSMGHARAILGLDDERRMAELARRVVGDGLSVRAVEEHVRRQRGSAEPSRAAAKPARAAADPHLRQLESELQRLLGTGVRIHVGRGETGRVEIPFFGTEDFERVMEILLGEEAVSR
ncbi:MAG TPA: ParB/RepB/Spo0J family partition protein [Longimicrobiaceae bacterium]|nr:ParB/RepB/Spo0J family partition protein [Longimicrobiaceae bacterium]